MRRWVPAWANQFMVALRAKQLDVWAADFLNRHPNAVVLHLGAGWIAGCSVSIRRQRCSGSTWTMPDVIELRRKLYSDRDGYQMIASSVTDPAWLDCIPADRPALVVAEGLLMYLTEAEARQLLGASPTGSAPASCCRSAIAVGSADLQAHRVGNARRS